VRAGVVEGTWFAVPLRSTGFAVGVVARTSGSAIILAYFFAARGDRLPTHDEVKALKAADAVRVLRISSLRMVNGSWPILGVDQNWFRDQWPMPRFLRREPISNRTWIVEYSDSDPSNRISETRTHPDTKLELDDLYGAGAVEIRLTKVLG
jgi:hypothetical protein